MVSHGGTVNKAQIGIAYLEKLTPWNGRGGFALEGIVKVLKRLGDPQDSYPTIHIAGTNGKGSVSSGISSILGAAGYRVGLNSSPHLQSLNERIAIDGLPIDSTALGEFRHKFQRILLVKYLACIVDRRDKQINIGVLVIFNRVV